MKPLETVYEANHQGNEGTTDGEESNAEDVNGYYRQEAVHYGQFSAKENPLLGNPPPHSVGTDPPSNGGRLKIVPSKPPRTTKNPKPKMADTFDIVDDGDDSLVTTNDVENWVLHRRNPDPIGREFPQTSPAHDAATINVEIVGNDNNREIVFQNGDDATRSNGLRPNGLDGTLAEWDYHRMDYHRMDYHRMDFSRTDFE